MKTIELELALMRHFKYHQKLVVPCVNSAVLFEVDLLVLTDAGYATGVEIKVSKSDLKNDLKKPHIKDLDKITYGGQLGFVRYFNKFKHFYYAVPDYLEEDALNQIPDWCGLLIAKKYPASIYYPETVRIKEIRKPKLLFNNKWDNKQKYHLAKLGAMRIYNLKSKNKNYENAN